MPQMGESITEGTVIVWLKKPGDTVELDEPLLEIGTDKVDTEVPSPAAGVLQEIVVPEGETVDVGVTIAILQTDVEAISGAGQTDAPPAAEPVAAPVTAAPAAQEDAVTSAEATPPASTGERVFIKMPKMGESITEGTVIAWHKQVGDAIELDETLLEIGTDKVDTEVPSPAAGIVLEILVPEGETVDVGTVDIAVIGQGVAAGSSSTPVVQVQLLQIKMVPPAAQPEPNCAFQGT